MNDRAWGYRIRQFLTSEKYQTQTRWVCEDEYLHVEKHTQKYTEEIQKKSEELGSYSANTQRETRD